MSSRALTITPTRFVTARHGALDPVEQFHWALASHALGAAVKRGVGAGEACGDGEVWLAAGVALWPEARALDTAEQLKPVLDAKLGRAAALALRDRCVAEVDWALGRVGPGRCVHAGVSVARVLDDGTRVFGQIPFLLDDDGTWTLVSLDDGARSRDLVRCWALLAGGLPRSPGVRFIRLLDPVGRRVDELLWDAEAEAAIAAELTASAPVLAA